MGKVIHRGVKVIHILSTGHHGGVDNFRLIHMLSTGLSTDLSTGKKVIHRLIHRGVDNSRLIHRVRKTMVF